MRRRIGFLQQQFILDKSALIQQAAIELPEWASSVLGCYIGVQGEVQTDRILAQGWKEGKTMCVPALKPETNTYELTIVRPEGRMITGPMNIPQPEMPEWIQICDVETIFVPGLAFDALGGRLGHGGGHYDRILKGALERTMKVGLCFDFQIVEKVPMLGLDVALNALVSESGITRCASGRTDVRPDIENE